MRLSSLKLSGFKSFADSTTLNFKANRTAVVGPNGCGKSNVIDAILIRKSQQAALFMEDFCRHLRNLVLESLTRMKQIELAWARRSRR